LAFKIFIRYNISSVSKILNTMPEKKTRQEFFVRIILPTLLTIILFTVAIFAVVIPSFEKNILDKKREMIKELTNTAWSILEEFANKEKDSVFSRSRAQKEALTRINHLRYGEDGKDYFWITDMHPKMIMHPYRSELDLTDLSNYSDPEGKKLFIEFVKVVQKSGEGYVDYMWQWKDDSTKIVPKLSYVKIFNKWKWIIGTGIYIEDVKEEISELEKQLIWVSLVILIILSFLLFIIMHQSLKIEKEKLEAEKGLIESESKYKALVEASTEGLVMILDGQIVYANKTIYRLLGIQNAGTALVSKVLLNDNNNSKKYFKKLLEGEILSSKYETKILTENNFEADVILFTSEITFGKKSGYTVIVKDVSNQKEITDQLDESREKFKSLANNISVGIFRCALYENSRFIDVNKAAAKLLGYTKKEELYELNLYDFFSSQEEKKSFINNIYENGSIKNYVFQTDKGDGNTSIVSVSASLVKDIDEEPLYCDGILEDISEKIKLDEQRENLIVELQTSLHSLNQPLKHFAKNIITCDFKTTLSAAARLMTKKQYSALLIKNEADIIGIITDRDLRERAIAGEINFNEPVYKVMTSPLITIGENALVFEALTQMHEKSVRHLAVKNINGEVTSTISSEELLQVQKNSSSYLIREIEQAETLEAMIEKKEKLSRVVSTLVKSGAKSKTITKIISSVTDILTQKLIYQTIEKIGKPPADFVFIALGSQGREEQTLITDQDSGVIFDDSADNEQTKKYFEKLGEIVCDNLCECGYEYCRGNNMAKNPVWVQPLRKWKEQFRKWINTSEPQDLIEISIFFDFRTVYGNNDLTVKLRNYLFETITNKAAFFQHLALNCLSHKLPLNILGNIVVASGGEHPETFDIKKTIMPVTDFARIYSLKNNITAINTLDRLNELLRKNIITKQSYEEIVQAYNFLMQARFKHHIRLIEENNVADNFLNPNELTQIEQKTLKNILSQITSIQKKLSFDFTGEAL